MDLQHLAFDLLAYLAAIVFMIYCRALALRRAPAVVPRELALAYFFVLTNGVILGSVLFGSLNVYLAGLGPAIGKSIQGALVGGIIAVEVFKRYHGIRGSTGAFLVPGIALGVFVGRWGCFYAGLDDFTYGVQSGGLPGYDFGDGVPRHPVQLYEGFALLAFFGLAFVALVRGWASWWRRGFYYFCLFYGAQRFGWEFLKPYPEIVLGLNLFHILSLAMICYGVVMLRRSEKYRDASQIA